MLITIDGYCSQGKTCLGKRLAEELNLEFLSTGKLIRYIAHKVNILKRNNMITNEIVEKAVMFTENALISEILMCKDLKSRETEETLKVISDYEYIDERVINIIVEYSKNKDMLLDGRFSFKYFTNANKSYYFKSSLNRRALLASVSRKCSYSEAVDYIKFRDSFEKRYDIPKHVKIVVLQDSSKCEDIVRLLKDDIMKSVGR